MPPRPQTDTRPHAGPTIRSVDPGPVQSGFALYDGGRVLRSGVLPNCDLLRIVSDDNSDVLAIEC